MFAFQSSNTIDAKGEFVESFYVIEKSSGLDNGTYSCKVVYIQNGLEFPAMLVGTTISVEGTIILGCVNDETCIVEQSLLNAVITLL